MTVLSQVLPSLFLPHGGGPWNAMKDAENESGYVALRAYLEGIGKEFHDKLQGILVVSAHWEESSPTLHYGTKPGMLYDYSGFPPETYSLKWPAPGNPALAMRAAELLAAMGMVTGKEMERGYDHGTFVPLMVTFPGAHIPVAQLSLVSSLDPQVHFAMGQALESLRREGILIVCSGMSYHNMKGFFSQNNAYQKHSEAFNDWLVEAMSTKDPDARRAKLIAWEGAPFARECHPRSEHLVPLFVAAGAAGESSCGCDYSGHVMGMRISGFRCGEESA